MKRVFRHLLASRYQVKRAFPKASLAAIEQAIKDTESTHNGQVRFAVEHALELWPLLRGMDTRSRAIDVFSLLKVWDTEHNNGVLIYLLWADRAVEIVADRGIHARLGSASWEKICREMETSFRAGKFEEGVIFGIHAVGSELQKHFPHAKESNELPDHPVLL